MLVHETLRIVGAAIILIVAIVGTLRQRSSSWYFLLAWTTLQLAVIIIDALIAFAFVGMEALKIQFAVSLTAKVLLLCGLLGFAFSPPRDRAT